MLVKFLYFCLKINVNSFFEFTFFSQIYKLRQPFINQKNYQTSYYGSFINYSKYKLKIENQMVTKHVSDGKNVVKLTNN